MKKRYCDLCKKEITNKKIFELSIWDNKMEEDFFKVDLCRKCQIKLEKFIKEQEVKDGV